MTTKNTEQQREGLRRNEEKWGAALMDAGWTAVPSVLLERQQALRLDPVDLNILLQLARFWWYADRLPYPSKRAIADCIGVHPSTVRRRIAAMEQDGLIKRRPRFGPKDRRQESNAYSFEGLVKAATPFAEEALKEREERKTEDRQRRRRRGRKLSLVPSVEGKSHGA